MTAEQRLPPEREARIRAIVASWTTHGGALSAVLDELAAVRRERDEWERKANQAADNFDALSRTLGNVERELAEARAVCDAEARSLADAANEFTGFAAAIMRDAAGRLAAMANDTENKKVSEPDKDPFPQFGLDHRTKPA